MDQYVGTPECPLLTGLWGIALWAVGSYTDPWGIGIWDSVLRVADVFADIPESPYWTGLQDMFADVFADIPESPYWTGLQDMSVDIPESPYWTGLQDSFLRSSSFVFLSSSSGMGQVSSFSH